MIQAQHPAGARREVFRRSGLLSSDAGRLSLSILAMGLLPGTWLARAGTDSWGEQPNRFGLNFRAVFNVEADFKNLGGFEAQTDVGPAVSGVDHDYDDGFNRVDGGGNAGGATWYWRYERYDQVLNDETLVLSSTSATAGARLEGVNDDPQWGGEVTYTRELGWNGAYWWGLVAAVHWTKVRIAESTSFSSDATQTRDSYQILGPLPRPPYEGIKDTPGPQISDTPLRETATLPGVATTLGDYDLEADAFGGRFGLLFETPFTDWLDLQFGGGVAGLWIRGKFSFEERTTIKDVTLQQALSDTDEDFVVGGYGEAGFNVRLASHVNLLAGAQYYFLTDYTQKLGQKEVELKFRNSVAAVLGLTYTF